ncbi:hypothetical protein [Henriciella pelagia]|uniref:hypothetical protein n=1 Tax=Henriciella pelagia TaxID=1977912 RepID=UPI003513D6AE
MAYNSDYLQLSIARPGPIGMNEWIYDSLDAVGTVDGADYFSNAAQVGMNVGDRIYFRQWTTALPSTNSGSTSKNSNTVADAAWFLVTSLDGDAATVAQETAIVVAEA